MMFRFRELRQAKGITQEDFRNQFNTRFNRTYTAAAISQFENGKRTPEISALIDFADFYKVPLDYLIGREMPLEKPSEKFTDDEKALVEDYRSLDARGKNFVREAIDAGKLRAVFQTHPYMRSSTAAFMGV